MLNKYFSRIFCINLARRTDRMQYFYNVSKFLEFDYERIEGVDGSLIKFENPRILEHFHPGDVGCTLSHLKTVTRAKELNLENYLVFEDDIEPSKDFTEKFSSFMDQVPLDWDMIYFGVNTNNSNPPHVSENVLKLTMGYTTHAIAVKSTMYDALIEKWSVPSKQVDVLLSELHSDFNVYAFTPNLVGQKAGKSDILNKEVNYDFLLKR